MAYRILLVSGGTGGHVYPVVAIAKALVNQSKQNDQEIQMELVGDGKFLTQAAVELGLPLRSLPRLVLRRYFSVINVLDIFKIPVVFLKSLFYLWRFLPDIVFIKGSGAALIVGWIARMFFIPIIIHESDAIPSMTNKSLGGFAKKILISFGSSARYFDPARTIIVGQPVREEFLNVDKNTSLKTFNLSSNLPTVFVTGGSQGAKIINQLVIDSLVQLVNYSQIIHQSGDSGYLELDKQIKKLIEDGKDGYGQKIQANYRVLPFLNDQQMAAAYGAADVVISRSGAGSIFEIAAVGKPAILIPLANAASGHQMANAEEFAQYGAIILREENLSPHIFINEIKTAYEKRQELSERAKIFAKPDAANLIASQILF